MKSLKNMPENLETMTDFVRCFENFWSLGRCFDLFVDKHKPAFSLVEKCRLFPEKYTVKDHISNTKLEKGDHYYIQTRHKDLFSHYNLILRKL